MKNFAAKSSLISFVLFLFFGITASTALPATGYNSQSESFSLGAYKPARSLKSNSALFEESVKNLDNFGFQYVVFDPNDLLVKLNSSLDPKQYNITGFINGDLSLKVTNLDGKYLTVNNQTNQLQLLDDVELSKQQFAVRRDMIFAQGSSTWSVCGGTGADDFEGAYIYHGTLEENSQFCSSGGRELELKAIGDSGAIPDFPLN